MTVPASSSAKRCISFSHVSSRSFVSGFALSVTNRPTLRGEVRKVIGPGGAGWRRLCCTGLEGGAGMIVAQARLTIDPFASRSEEPRDALPGSVRDAATPA